MGMGLATKRGSGLLVGVLQGAVVSVIGLALASVVLPLPDQDLPRPSPSAPVVEALAPLAEPPVTEEEPIFEQGPEPVIAPEPVPAPPSEVVQGPAERLPEPEPQPMPEPVISKAVSPDAAPQPVPPPVSLPATTAKPMDVAIGRLPQVSAPSLERPDPAAPKIPAVADAARLITDPAVADPPLPDLSGPDLALMADPPPVTPAKTFHGDDMLPPALPLAERRVVLAPGPKLETPANPDLTAEQVRARLLQKATPFANPQNKPIFAILLMDDGGIGLDQLAQFKVPVSVAINPDWPDAPARAEQWRAAGFEFCCNHPSWPMRLILAQSIL